MEMRYKLTNRKLEDIYLKFKNGKQLVVEFQIDDVNKLYWEEKVNYLKKLDINSVLIFSKSRDLDFVNKQSQISYLKRILLKNKNKVIFLNSENKSITLMPKIEYKNSEGRILKDKIFSKEFKLDNVKILEDGNIIINANYEELFNVEKVNFIKRCRKERAIKEEKTKLLNKLNTETKKENIFNLSSENSIKKESNDKYKQIGLLEFESKEIHKESILTDYKTGQFLDAEAKVNKIKDYYDKKTNKNKKNYSEKTSYKKSYNNYGNYDWMVDKVIKGIQKEYYLKILAKKIKFAYSSDTYIAIKKEI